MNAATLPPTLTGLRQQLHAGGMTVDEALAHQARLLDQDARWHALTERLPVETPRNAALPLAGAALAHKDIFTIRNRPPRCGTAFAPDPTLPSSPVVQALEDAGGATLAAAGLAEYAGGVTGENPNFPLPVNPIDPAAAVGGSSSGSAVAVAAGLCYGSLGTDTAGSVRIPAATCGIVGLLPTRELLTRSGCFPLSPNLDTVGLLTRSAMDAAQLLANCLPAGQARRIFPALLRTDSATLAARGAQLHDSLRLTRRPRISLALEHPDGRFTPDAEHAQALTAFAGACMDVASFNTTTLGQQAELARCASILLHVDAAATHHGALRGNGPPLSDIPRAVALPGAALPAAWYAQCLQQRDRLRGTFCESHLSRADILLAPVLPHGVPDWKDVLTSSPAFKPVALLALFSWTAWVNYLGLPAVVFPVGQDRRGRPICIQAIGRPHSEALLLAFAYEYERARHGLSGFGPRLAAASIPPLPAKPNRHA